LIREAFQLVSTGLYSPAEVLKKVTSKGLRTTKGNPLTSQSFSDLLRKPIYAGWLVVEKWGLREKAQFEAIIDEHTFQRVQAILSGKRSLVNPRSC
jgi:Recombinase